LFNYLSPVLKPIKSNDGMLFNDDGKERRGHCLLKLIPYYLHRGAQRKTLRISIWKADILAEDSTMELKEYGISLLTTENMEVS
jgi:hypothetical protein